MQFELILPIKINDIVYVVEGNTINKWYVINIHANMVLSSASKDISYDVKLTLDRYNNDTDSYVIVVPLAYCFKTKDALLKSLIVSSDKI